MQRDLYFKSTFIILCSIIFLSSPLPDHPFVSAKTDSKAYHPIVVSGIFIGGYANKVWMDPGELFDLLNTEETFKIYSRDRYIGSAPGYKRDYYEDKMIEIMHPEYQENEYLAIQCHWNPLPRLAQYLNPNNKIYQQIIRDILKKNGLSQTIPINITQLIKVDLEGDGVDEVIIAAENISPLTGYLKNNDYSILLVRKLINNKVETFFIAKDIIVTDKPFEFLTPITYELKFLIDADGDGALELLVKSSYYEGVGYLLYKWNDRRFELVLENGIGA